jgi:hypothetical protein
MDFLGTELHLSRLFGSMAGQTCSIMTVARPLIEQCRRDIDELGWQHLEAAREMLKRTRWLVARWEAQHRAPAPVGTARLPSFEAGQGTIFIPVESATRR